jgi:hypothetical protein
MREYLLLLSLIRAIVRDRDALAGGDFDIVDRGLSNQA